jgi:transcriptional regulator with XRE-family HTH domain
MTQKALAESIGRVQSRVAKWEKSEGQPGPSELFKLAKSLETSLDYLCDDQAASPYGKSPERTVAHTPTCEPDRDERLILELARWIGHDAALNLLLSVIRPPQSVIASPPPRRQIPWAETGSGDKEVPGTAYRSLEIEEFGKLRGQGSSGDTSPNR